MLWKLQLAQTVQGTSSCLWNTCHHTLSATTDHIVLGEYCVFLPAELNPDFGVQPAKRCTPVTCGNLPLAFLFPSLRVIYFFFVCVQDESGTADSSGLDDSSQDRFIGPLSRDGTVGCSSDYSSPSYSYSSILNKSETGNLL